MRRVQGSVLSEKWEPLLNNLGHVARKLGRYDDALSYHRSALVLKPLCASTYSALGYAQALQGDLAESVESFHKALGLRRDDTFATTMLNNVVEQMTTEDPPFLGHPAHVPRFGKLMGKSAAVAGENDDTGELASSGDDVEMVDSSDYRY